MEYENIAEGRFLERVNRFIARVELLRNGVPEIHTVHVKNTGRCKELFVKDARVYLEKSENTSRKTEYDLVAVEKGNELVNVDSSAPNASVGEWIAGGGEFSDVTLVRPETSFEGSRFDFYIEAGARKIFMEVKGVTLERQGLALFPDAPSERALKHVEELIRACRKGYEAYIVFVIQMKGVNRFSPNRDAQPELADALIRARDAGVHILAYDCLVQKDRMALDRPVRVELQNRTDCLRLIATPLFTWYDKSRRFLPWREEPTPYRVWISEIMLQQTRVEAVKPYFDRFMTALPDIRSLSKVPEDVLLKLWEGLGYYNRARNLKEAAIQIEEQFGGRMPGDYDLLLTLKGVGSYTAGAIASIAFGQPVPAVDGNVLRVISRLLEDEDDILNQKVKKRVEIELLSVMPKDRPGDFNQALMELGATVCLPNGAPKCRECPWEDICMSHRHGTEMEYPKKSPKKARRTEKKTILVIRDDRCTAIRKRAGKGLLAGLYEFPSLEGHAGQEEALEYVRSMGITPLRIRPLPASKHIFTHRVWEMTGYEIRVDELAPIQGDTGMIFVRPEETEEKYPIPSAFAAYTEYLNIKTGNHIFKGGKQPTKGRER